MCPAGTLPARSLLCCDLLPACRILLTCAQSLSHLPHPVQTGLWRNVYELDKMAGGELEGLAVSSRVSQ